MKHSADNGGDEVSLYVINEQYKYSELTAKVIGCAMTVHLALGNGFL